MNRVKLILNNVTLMKRIGFTLVVLLFYKIGTYIPIPLLNVEGLQGFMQEGGFLDLLNTFSGNALGRFSILALGITPYITASIVIQLLQMDIIPILKEWSEQGEVGKQKINQVTRYMAIGLSFIQGLALLLGLSTSDTHLQLGVSSSPIIYVYMAFTIAAGTAFLMWLGDLITRKGIGNGTSMIITAGILTSLPSMMTMLWNKYISGGSGGVDILYYFIILGLYVGILVGVIYIQLASRKIPIQYANRQGKSDSNIPIKLNSAGVIPVIFASTIISVPLSVVGFVPNITMNAGAGYWINQIFNYQNPLGFVIYVSLIFVFSFFYAFLTINPEKIANNLQKSNAYIPGVRPGEDTQNYVARVLFKITLLGATYLAFLAIIPLITARIFNFSQAEASVITIGGTSLLIIVGVAIETTKQIEADANEKQYSGFLK